MSTARAQSNDRAVILRILMLFGLIAAGFGRIPAAQAQSQNLYWLNSQTGDSVVWYLNGPRWTGNYDYLAHNLPLAWQMVGNGDFNGDGNLDFIWQNTQTGDVTYWQMNGITIHDTGFIAHNIPLAWKVVGVGTSMETPISIWSGRTHRPGM